MTELLVIGVWFFSLSATAEIEVITVITSAAIGAKLKVFEFIFNLYLSIYCRCLLNEAWFTIHIKMPITAPPEHKTDIQDKWNCFAH